VKINFVLPHAGLTGGIRVCAIYADHLQRRGHEVYCVSVPRRDLSLYVKAKNMIQGKPWKRELRGPSHLDSVPHVKHTCVETFRPILDSDLPDADVCLATWWETAEWVAKLSPHKGVKLHLVQHDETQMSNQQVERVEATWRLPLQRVVVARWLADLGRDRYGVNNIAVVPNGVDPAQFNAPPRTKQRVPTVGMMYSPIYFKGCDVAIEAFKIARNNIPNLRLIAFGTEYPTAEMPLPEGTEFHRRPEQHLLKNIYASCDAWLFSSRSEGFGLPILESMACRTPVIGTPAGAAPELINEGGGWLVKPQDAIDMAIAIERVARLGDRDWQEESEAAARTAASHTWEKSVDRFEEFLQNNLRRGKAA
jgi:glycosyltransferase involved in cell wall biosynthesis